MSLTTKTERTKLDFTTPAYSITACSGRRTQTSCAVLTVINNKRMHGLELSETRECSANVRHGARATEMPENESAAQ